MTFCCCLRASPIVHDVSAASCPEHSCWNMICQNMHVAGHISVIDAWCDRRVYIFRVFKDSCCGLLVWWPVGLRSSCCSQPCLCQNGPSDQSCGLFVWWPIGHSQLALVKLFHYIDVVHWLCDDAWGVGLPATVNTFCVKIVHQIVVVDCLRDDP